MLWIYNPTHAHNSIHLIELPQWTLHVGHVARQLKTNPLQISILHAAPIADVANQDETVRVRTSRQAV